jgi:DNA-binding GntR family transcriptional regulator
MMKRMAREKSREMGGKVALAKTRKRVRPALSVLPAKREILKRQTTAEQVAVELRSRIIAGEIGEGDQLLQEQLASELGVSRIPLREAMRQLEAEGLITLTSHRGGVVSVLSMDQIRELFEIRACLETWLLTVAIPMMNESDFEALDAIIDEMRPGEIAHWGELNWRFHQALYARAGRDQTLQLLRRIHHNLDRYLRVQISATSGWQKANVEHRGIVEFCRSKDVRRATAMLDSHIMDASTELIEALAKRRAKAK